MALCLGNYGHPVGMGVSDGRGTPVPGNPSRDEITFRLVFWVGSGGLVFKAHKLSNHSTLASKITKKKKVGESGPLKAVHVSRHKWPGASGV